MKLYEIPPNSKMKLEFEDAQGKTKIEDCIFHHIDGMYSLCTKRGGKSFHLSASTPMRKENDYYVIDERKGINEN